MEMALSKLKELRQRDRELEALEAKLHNTTTTPKTTTMDPLEAKRIQQELRYQRWLVRENKRKAMRLQNLNATTTAQQASRQSPQNTKSYAYNPKVAMERYLQRFQKPKVAFISTNAKNAILLFAATQS